MLNIHNATKEEFQKFYYEKKHDGLTDWEIALELNTNYATVNVLKGIYEVDTIRIRKNNLGVSEEHFRKGAKLGLTRRIILQRVRDGFPISVAINTPKQMGKRLSK